MVLTLFSVWKSEKKGCVRISIHTTKTKSTINGFAGGAKIWITEKNKINLVSLHIRLEALRHRSMGRLELLLFTSVSSEDKTSQFSRSDNLVFVTILKGGI